MGKGETKTKRKNMRSLIHLSNFIRHRTYYVKVGIFATLCTPQSSFCCAVKVLMGRVKTIFTENCEHWRRELVRTCFLHSFDGLLAKQNRRIAPDRISYTFELLVANKLRNSIGLITFN